MKWMKESKEEITKEELEELKDEFVDLEAKHARSEAESGDYEESSKHYGIAAEIEKVKNLNELQRLVKKIGLDEAVERLEVRLDEIKKK